jgi:hypothetical protein
MRVFLFIVLFSALILAVVPMGMSVHADTPTTLAFSANPSVFATGQAATTFVCMAQQSSPAPSFTQGDISSFVFDQTLGNVTSVDLPITVNSSTLSAADFTVSQGANNTNKVILTYTAASPKTFGFGNSICAKVHFTANASPAAALVRFSNKFTGAINGLLPSVVISVVDPSVLASTAALGSTNFLPGTASGSITVDRNTDANLPGNSLSLIGGAPAAGSTDKAGGDIIIGAGAGTGLGGGGNVEIQTAGKNDLSGTSDNLLVDREIFVAKGKQLTLSAPGFTSLLSIHLTGTHTAGGRVFYTVRATDGGSQIATESGVIQYLATANSITCTVQTTDKLHLGTVNSGCTPGFFNPGSQPGISIFDNVTFSSPAPIVVHEVYFRITNDSGSSIRLEP